MNRKLMRMVALILAVILGISVLSTALIIMANSEETSAQIQDRINGLQDEAEELVKRREELEKEIASTKQESLSASQKKTQIDQQIEITRLQIRNMNGQILAYNQRIAETQKLLDESLAEQQAMNEKYKARIRAMEENGSISYWAVLFKSKSISDLIDRISVIGEIARADQNMLKEMEKNNEAIAALREKVEEDRSAVLEKNAELEALNATLVKQNAAANQLMKDLANQAASMALTAKELQEQEEKLRKEIIQQQKRFEEVLEEEKRRALEEANRHNPAGGDSGASNPMFASPLPKGSCVVKVAYGYRIHQVYGYYSMHHGVDLGAAKGTPVYAIATGYVTIASYENANGNYVSLTHGNGYASVYGHLDSYTVKEGDYVKEGQLIGYVGATGWVTEPCLYLEILKNESSLNPMKYISIS